MSAEKSPTKQSPIIYLQDYQAPAYHITHCELTFTLEEEATWVASKLSCVRVNPNTAVPLILAGRGLELLELAVDGKTLEPSEYSLEAESLTLFNLANFCTITSVCKIYPQDNHFLEGLYKSGGNFCTQCEPEGFRRITYYLDRPDNMAKFQVRITADKARYPQLLANGHCIDQGELEDGKHFCVWEDPFPKPSYLFALVAGRFAKLEDSFATRSGKTVRLSIYSDPEHSSKCVHAMDSLKKALRWDEDEFGLECDLSHYQVVAISDFNLGAMENKGLNIFNTSLILANPDVARDENYQDILAVVGHEYFHNWTGNRVTCRDWFQLCLKEGLTVFRDQEFSRSQYSAAVKRIEDISALRQSQWPEDDSPFAHPPRPSSYVEINNFYTATVYNKGAEVVRMLDTLIGRENFRLGLQHYLTKFDGKAVCQEDFVNAMAEVSGHDLSQFMLWYTQAGTPRVAVQEAFDQTSGTYSLSFTQSYSDNPLLQGNQPVVLPLRLSLLDPQSGKPLPLQLDNEKGGDKKKLAPSERLFKLCTQNQTLCFQGLKQKPIASLFRNGSAAAKITGPHSRAELAFLMAHDNDPFSVWDAGQSLTLTCLLEIVAALQKAQAPKLDPDLAKAFGALLGNPDFDPDFKALALSLPSETLLAQQLSEIDVPAVHEARKWLRRELARCHETLLNAVFHSCQEKGAYNISQLSVGKRSLKNLCLGYLFHLDEERYGPEVLAQFHSSNNMTDRDAALHLLLNSTHPARQRSLEAFYESWQHEDLALDRWFALQARASTSEPEAVIRGLLAHRDFSLVTPNRVRAVLLTFCNHNPTGFHHPSGFAYELWAEFVLKLNSTNRQMAGLLAKSLNQWRRYPLTQQKLMQTSLLKVQNTPGLSSDVFEVVSKALAAP